MEKTVLVIGATSGIGKSVAKKYLSLGHRVIATGRRVELLADLQTAFPQTLKVVPQDVSVLSFSDSLKNILACFGDFHIAIFSSGVGSQNPRLAWDLEKNVLDVNVLGFTQIAQGLFSYFRASQQPGHIVAISSIAGIRGLRQAPAYSASKAYQSTLLESLRNMSRHQQLDIEVTDVRPGFVKTDMAPTSGTFWMCSADKAADLIHRAIEKKKRVAYVTRRWFFIALILKWVPSILLEKV